MAFRKVSVPAPEDPSKTVDGYDIPVAESIERWSEVKLEDGMTLRAKISIVGAIKLTDRVDAQGNPVYLLNAAPIITMGAPGSNTTKDA